MTEECVCDICENHEYDGINRMSLEETKKYIRVNKEMLDKRKSYLTFYNYCPWCGNKINWTKVKKLLTK